MWISCIKIRNGQIISMQREDGIYYMFVVDWLNGLKNENGKWDMGKSSSPYCISGHPKYAAFTTE